LIALEAAVARAPAWQRLAAALLCSIALHLLLLAIVRAPAAPRGLLGAALRITLAPEGAPQEAPEQPPAPAPARPLAPPKQDQPKKTEEVPKAAPPAPAAATPPPGASFAASAPRLAAGSAWVSISPAPEPRQPPEPEVLLRDTYLEEAGLARFPGLVGELDVRYPPEARQARRRGVVVVQVMVDAEGRVVEAQALPGAPEDLAGVALDALRRARFEPPRARDGSPARARLYVQLSFVIE
jgi:TonB family protein